jgi:hypothetical protein
VLVSNRRRNALGNYHPLPESGVLAFGRIENSHIQCWYRVRYNVDLMERARKITVEIPPELLEKAQRASGAGITQTVRTGLQLVAASQTYAKLRRLRGKIRFSRTSADLKIDR